jgi:VWFA-related protein
MRSFPLNPVWAARSGAGLAYLSVLAWSISAALSQTPVLKTRTKEEREAIYNNTHRMTINVQVSDSTGNPVSDLEAADFAIYDNQQLRKIAAFHPIDGAALYDASRVLILLDAVNSPPEVLEAERSGIFKYLAESRKPFPYPTSFVLWFNGHLQATAETTDRNAIGRAFVKMMKGVHSNACSANAAATGQPVTAGKEHASVDAGKCRAVHFKDSIAALSGIAQQQQAGGGRTLLIWVGPGWPILSNDEFQRLSPQEQRAYAGEIASLTHDLGTGQVTLYSVSPDVGADAAAGQRNDGVSRPSAIITRRLALEQLVQQTGGRVMAASKDLPTDLGRCARDAEWYYALSFNAPPAQNGAGEFHSLAIKVNRPGLQVRTVNAYYTQP